VTHPPPLICAALTDVGRVRARNEDCILADAALGLFAVADGLGGRQAGEVASRLAIDTLAATIATGASVGAATGAGTGAAVGAGTGADPRDGSAEIRGLVSAVETANARVFRQSCLDRRLAGMGTTLVAATVSQTPQGERVLTVVHVGDSRLYRFHPATAVAAAELRCLTRDHSAVQELIDQGLHTPEEAERLVSRNYLTRALGVEPAVAVDHSSWTLLPGEIILLCSDGLTNMLDDATIAACIEGQRAATGLDALAAQLVAAANERGGHDNISVVLAATI